MPTHSGFSQSFECQMILPWIACYHAASQMLSDESHPGCAYAEMKKAEFFRHN